MYPIYECSLAAKEKIEPKELPPTKPIAVSELYKNVKYPFQALNVGQAFAVPFGDVPEMHLRNMASFRGRHYQMKYTLIKHKELQVYEVARIA